MFSLRRSEIDPSKRAAMADQIGIGITERSSKPKMSALRLILATEKSGSP
jgi:hypothetical protein